MKLPWLLAASGLLLAFAIDLLISLITAVRHYPANYPARLRVLDLLSWGSVLWALLLIVAVALIRIPSRIFSGENRPTGFGGLLLDIAAIAASAVVVAALISLIINLTLLPSSDLGLSRAFVGALDALAAIPIAGGAALWAYDSRPKRPKPPAAPPQYGPPPGQPGGYAPPPPPGFYPPQQPPGGYGQPPG